MITIPPRTLADLEWQKILDALAGRSKTDLGRTRCLARSFLDEPEDVRESLARIEEVRALAVEQRLSIPVWGVRDIRGPVDRASKGGMLEPAELVACAAVLEAMGRVKDFVEEKKDRLPRAHKIASRMTDFAKVTRRIERAFEPSGELSDRASPTLGDLRERSRGLHRSIKGKLDTLLHNEEFTKLLRENYFTIRNERYVVPVLAATQSQVPGIVHNASQSGQTLFVEPEPLIGLGNQLAIAQSMVLEEERRILLELSRELGFYVADIEVSLDAAAELDVIEAGARLALDLDAYPPEIVAADAPLHLSAMRHPLLVLAEKRVIANDVSMEAGARVLVISGPNAGGKTVTLTGVGLCAMLLRAGLPVPAEKGSRLPLFKSVRTAIGDHQDLSRDLSTFSAHLTTLKEIIEVAGVGSLVLIDEIAADTDPREGAAIALAVLEDLSERGARVLVTTHLEELKAVAMTDRNYVNARVGFDARQMAPTYRLQYGSPGSSSAIDIARRVGLDARICARAEENLKGSAGPLGLALVALEKERAGLEASRRALDEERKLLASEHEEIAQQRAAVADRERAIEAEARKELLLEVERSRAEVAKILAELQGAPTIRKAVEAQAELTRAAEEERRKSEKQKSVASIADDERLPAGSAIEVGMRVKISTLGKDGEVLEIDGDEALVAAGAMKLRQKLVDLVPLKAKQKQQKAPQFKRKDEDRIKAAEGAKAEAISYESTKVDVRGMRADDALKAVEVFLDRCYGEGQKGAVIVHGLGTGALKMTVRDYLKSSPYVSNFRAGQGHEGGEGVTIAEFKG